MSAKKSPPKHSDHAASVTSIEQIRASEERPVHTEEMKATVGDVLKAEHFEEAMRAEHLKAELPKGTAPAPTPAPAPVPAAQRTEKRDDPREQKRPAAKMKGWARLSPKFLLSASWLAVIEILSGAKRARTELVGAVGKARHRYDAPQS